MNRADKPVHARTAANPDWGKGTESFEGMTLLEHYAGLAMQGLIAVVSDNGTYSDMDERCAQMSVTYARALIAELEKEAK